MWPRILRDWPAGKSSEVCMSLRDNKGEKMSEGKLTKDQLGRRGFVSLLGGMCATTAVCSTVAAVALEGGAVAAKAAPAKPEFPAAGPVPDNDWSKRRWAFGSMRSAASAACAASRHARSRTRSPSIPMTFVPGWSVMCTSRVKINRASTPSPIR